MKYFFIIFAFTLGFANSSVQDIYDIAKQIEVDQTIGDKEQPLIKHYSESIAALDSSTLEQNPELVFRKALLEFDLLQKSRNIVTISKKLSSLEKDFYWIIQHTNDPKLYDAAKDKEQYCNAMLRGGLKGFDDLITKTLSHAESILLRFASTPNLTGKALREDVLKNLKNCDKKLEEFKQATIFLTCDPELILGNTEIKTFEILEVRQEEEMWFLIYKMEYVYKVDDQNTHTITSITHL